MSEVKLPVLRAPVETLEKIINDKTRSYLDDIPMPFKVLLAFEGLVEQPAQEAELAAAEFERQIFSEVKSEMSTATPDDIESLQLRSEQRRQVAFEVQERISQIFKELPVGWKTLAKKWISNNSSLEAMGNAAGNRWLAAHDRWMATYDRIGALVDAHDVEGDSLRNDSKAVVAWKQAAMSWMAGGDRRQQNTYWCESAYEFLASGLHEVGFDVKYRPYSLVKYRDVISLGPKQNGPTPFLQMFIIKGVKPLV